MSDSMPEQGTTAVPTASGGMVRGPSGEDPVPDGAGAPLDPAAPVPLGVPRTATGDAGVDAGLERLADADHLPTEGHVEVYEDVHRGLRETLTALDAGPVPAPVPPYDHRS
ncbi:hypothetical protein ACIO87_28565 [Streptomyces sp. NPDC087218]|uniref:hypothetical protein n=1 Tax=Streptomyces sp. NPDC087218 TaxID=3365769 RepID=UPI0038045921